MFERYFISNHAIERYRERIRLSDTSDRAVIRAIRRDLRSDKVRRIYNLTRNGQKQKYVFSYNGKKFVFIYSNMKKSWILESIVKYHRYEIQEQYEKYDRLRELELQGEGAR